MNKKAEKPHDLFVSAVIVAAGRGTRMNMEVNKQYVEVGGIPVLARTLRAFEENGWVDEIVVVVNEQEMMLCKQQIIEAYGFTKVRKLVSGADTRQKSVLCGLREVMPSSDIVLIHDGARPFIHKQSLIESITAACEYGAACVAVPVKDTVKKTDPMGFVEDTPDRNTLWAVQTPQTFRYRLILKAHEEAVQSGFEGTDDAVLVERMGHKLKLVMGDYYNIKITTREDLVIAEAIAEVISR